ncbi:MAG: chemotaxis protein CheX [Fusobacteriaceae bacterium]|nr:chemotaxis protein CheX [Fusobacteriaceae bacterium]MBN2838316.1 chemotaxis protein CheX [Fusobacteriaceae bacterium]
MSRLLYERIINDAIKETSRKIFGKVPEITKIGETKSPISVESFNVILGIVGDITGQIIFNFKGESPQKIVSKLLNRDLKNEEELQISGIAEFANILSGNAVTDLFEETKAKIDITPPSIILGNHIVLSTVIHDISEFSLNLAEMGDITMYIAIKEKSDNN